MMASDLVSRLREFGQFGRDEGGAYTMSRAFMATAADEIDALTARIAELERDLKNEDEATTAYAWRAKAASEVFQAQVNFINELESELAAARKPPEGDYPGLDGYRATDYYPARQAGDSRERV